MSASLFSRIQEVKPSAHIEGIVQGRYVVIRNTSHSTVRFSCCLWRRKIMKLTGRDTEAGAKAEADAKHIREIAEDNFMVQELIDSLK